MDDRKDARTGSGWLGGTGSGFRQEPEFEKLAEARNRPGLRSRVQPAHRFRFGAGSQGINSRILLPLTTLVHFPLRVSRAH